MRDLKHLTYFEDLLQEANNALVVQAQAEGKKCVAFVCENTPEPLMNLDNTFGVRLHAPNTGSMDIATYYMTSLLCETSRSLLERAVEGGFNFADCVIAPDGCTMINRCVENMELLKTMGAGKDHFFYEYMEIPLKADDNGVDLLVLQCKTTSSSPCTTPSARTCPTPPSVGRWPSTTACVRSSARSATSARRSGRASRVTNSTC